MYNCYLHLGILPTPLVMQWHPSLSLGFTSYNAWVDIVCMCLVVFSSHHIKKKKKNWAMLFMNVCVLIMNTFKSLKSVVSTELVTVTLVYV